VKERGKISNISADKIEFQFLNVNNAPSLNHAINLWRYIEKEYIIISAGGYIVL